MAGHASLSSSLFQQRHTGFSWLYLVMQVLPSAPAQFVLLQGEPEQTLLCLHSCDIGKGQETALLAKKLLEASTFKAWKTGWGKLQPDLFGAGCQGCRFCPGSWHPAWDT